MQQIRHENKGGEGGSVGALCNITARDRQKILKNYDDDGF